MKIFVWILGSAVLLALAVMAVVVSAAVSDAAPSGYTVFLQDCDAPAAMLGEHVASFVILDEARAWADTMVALRYDVALIYRVGCAEPIGRFIVGEIGRGML